MFDMVGRCNAIEIAKRHSLWLTALGIAAVMMLALISPGISSPALAASETTIRPVSDFVDSQGTYCIDDGNGGCFLFIDPIPNYGGWGNQAGDRCASVDYAGIANAWINGASGGGISFGTTFDGKVVERPLADGRAEVTVLLKTHNALTWVQECGDFASAPLLFGQRAEDVLNGGAEPVLGESFMKLVFINSAPGAPLPDLFQLFFEHPEDAKFLSITAKAQGALHEAFGVPEGTTGQATIVQTGLYGKEFNSNSNVAEGDPQFPAERIELRVVGN